MDRVLTEWTASRKLFAKSKWFDDKWFSLWNDVFWFSALNVLTFKDSALNDLTFRDSTFRDSSLNVCTGLSQRVIHTDYNLSGVYTDYRRIHLFLLYTFWGHTLKTCRIDAKAMLTRSSVPVSFFLCSTSIGGCMDQISTKTPNPKCRLILKIYQ